MKTDKQTFDERIQWFIADAPGVLGLSGFDPSSMSSSEQTITSSDPYHAKMHGSLWAVARYRECEGIWKQLSAQTRAVLSARYTPHAWPLGVRGQFGEIAGVAQLNVGMARLVQLASNQALSSEREKAKRRAEVALRHAHAEWREVEDRARADCDE